MKYLATILLILLSSCRMYDRNYTETIPVPDVVTDTIDSDNWDDKPTREPIL